MWDRWREFRRRQREALRESNRPRGIAPGQVGEEDVRLQRDLLSTVLPPVEGATTPAPTPGSPQAAGVAGAAGAAASGASAGGEAATGAEGDHHAGEGEAPGRRFGQAGRPLNRQSPFYVGFVGAFGVIIALGLWHLIGRLSAVITLIVVAFFLTLALDPIVTSLTRREIKRPAAVSIVFAGVLVVFTLIGLLVVPPVVEQGTQLVQDAPGYVDSVLDSRVVRQVDRDYQVVDKISEEFNKRVTDSAFLSQVFGGVLGAGRAVVTGVFQFFTVMILTLFFLGNLPKIKRASFEMVPASRRPRVVSLSEEIMRRAGSYAIGQVAVATINAILSWVMMSIVGIPYAAVLAVLVGILGLVPMVGATLGAALVCTVALFDEPRKAIIALVYYIVYQQVENYLVVPRIMQRTVSVPGAVTVVAALAGGTLLGVLGALLAIPIAAGLLLLYEEVLLPRQRRH
ncbi:AI-2E family transporter [Knoellia sp. p5-6-4]|uniref:AI-2E family transporter n=1 Tax=unclassified Knoellia TaxID=2618719 RepID=UPI0023DAAA4C|nr:AI-2E family transporter [Knoellia sp. p5-6-4]MDF2144063.1 AI-2E family transporter [Knoellia sp. p5-6-4]